MEIDHFGHDDPLVFTEIKRRSYNENKCQACELPISTGFAYSCVRCYFHLHSSCAEFPREMTHPFHPQHTLTLTIFNKPHFRHSARPPDPLRNFDCHVCGLTRQGYSFHCSECEFDVDVHCADLKPKKGISSSNYKNNDNQRLMITHPHPLITCDYKNSNINATIKCTCCQQPIVSMSKGTIFVCLECRVVLDESCARLPLEIRHPFHPFHSLTLLDSRSTTSRPNKCHACGHDISGFSYQCLQCDFELDVLCATLTPITNGKSNEDNEHVGIITTTPHPLITCHKTNNSFPLSCSMCLQPLKEDCIYVCLDCKKLLHKSCACLPREISEHPYHPEHPLSLGYPIDDTMLRLFDCAACQQDWCDSQGFVYVCPDCRFILHTRCALSVPPLIKTQLHLEHPLAFMEIQKHYIFCDFCEQGIWDYPFFRCMECKFFTLHAHCLPELPPTIKHTCHLHLLTLTNLPIKDYEDEDDDSEFLCDACEKERRLGEPTYYCADCHFVAHVHCVISEISSSLQRETSSEVLTLLTEINELKAQLEAITKQIDSRRMELKILKAQRSQAEYSNLPASKKAELRSMLPTIQQLPFLIATNHDQNNRCNPSPPDDDTLSQSKKDSQEMP